MRAEAVQAKHIPPACSPDEHVHCILWGSIMGPRISSSFCFLVASVCQSTKWVYGLTLSLPHFRLQGLCKSLLD